MAASTGTEELGDGQGKALRSLPREKPSWSSLLPLGLEPQQHMLLVSNLCAANSTYDRKRGDRKKKRTEKI
jgi:hypothetical protein